MLWSVGDKEFNVEDSDEGRMLQTISLARQGPVAVRDIDGDGNQEVVCFMVDEGMSRNSK